MKISINRPSWEGSDLDSGWDIIDVDFSSTENLRKICTQYNYSAHQFKDGKRLSENHISSDSLIADWDDGLTIEQAMVRFSEFIYFLISSRNHQKVKDGKPAVDRFHIIFPFKSPSTDGKKYKEWKSFDLFSDSDISVIEPARGIFFSPADAVYHHNIQGKYIDEVYQPSLPAPPTPKTGINFGMANLPALEKIRKHCLPVDKCFEDIKNDKATHTAGHQKRIVAASFIKHTIDDEEYVKELFSHTSDYDEKTTLYQYKSVNHNPITCKAMQGWNLCRETCQLMKDIGKNSPIAFRYKKEEQLRSTNDLISKAEDENTFNELIRRAKEVSNPVSQKKLLQQISTQTNLTAAEVKRYMKDLNMRIDEVATAIQVIEKHKLMRYNQDFFQYQDGIWNKKSNEEIESLIHHEIKQYSDNRTISEVINAVRRESLITEDTVNAGFNKYEIACDNGLLNVESGVFRPLAEHDYRFQKMKGAYDPTAVYPGFTTFIDELFMGDPDADDKKKLLQEISGYLLIPDYSLVKKMFYFWGPKANNGKSSFLDVIREVMGNSYIEQVPLDHLKGFLLERLAKAHANLVGDQDANTTIPDGVLKQLVGGRDSMVADRKYKDAINFKNHARLIFAVNKLPVSLHKDAGYYTRVVILTFNNSFVMNPDPNDPHQMKADPAKIDKIIEDEKSGILNWMIEGLQRLMKSGDLTLPKSSEEAIDEYEESSNPLKSFVEEECDKILNIQENRTDVYDRYKKWCKLNGHKPYSAGNFYDHMNLEDNISLERDENGRYIEGITLKPSTMTTIKTDHHFI